MRYSTRYLPAMETNMQNTFKPAGTAIADLVAGIKEPEEFYIVSTGNGVRVTQGFYPTFRQAQKAARRANEIAPDQKWCATQD